MPVKETQEEKIETLTKSLFFYYSV